MRVGRKGFIKGIIPASTIEFCIEMDVRQTADGHLVLLHDETVDRTTDGTGAVSELTLKQVKTLDAGMGSRIPTLEGVFSHFARDEVILNLEIKSSTPRKDRNPVRFEYFRRLFTFPGR